MGAHSGFCNLLVPPSLSGAGFGLFANKPNPAPIPYHARLEHRGLRGLIHG
jgi:hypothetical protein